MILNNLTSLSSMLQGELKLFNTYYNIKTNAGKQANTIGMVENYSGDGRDSIRHN
jgi:hypothetical protein